MMRILIIALVFVLIRAHPTEDSPDKVEKCDKNNCVLPNCRCFSTEPPIEKNKFPQFVTLTFDDDVQSENYKYYSDLLYNKTNPDGSQISATFFVSHEYTDYDKVHALYLNQQEIALHSISHYALTTYWANISTDDLRAEFGDQKKIISHFARIPEDSIKGMRMPFLQLSGDRSFQVAKELRLKYDCSWPSQKFLSPGLWPYTLDYPSSQDCEIGPCPKSSIPGLWVVPMLDWTDNAGVHCSMEDACVNIPGDVDGILDWMIENFNRQYKGNRAPVGFYIHSAWFLVNKLHVEAYRKFVDYLLKLPDVFIVNIERLIRWMEHPVAIGSKDWPGPPTIKNLGCKPIECELKNKKGELRYMTHCADSCPASYPWVNNPFGFGNHT